MLRLVLIIGGIAAGLTGCVGTISAERARAQLEQTEANPPVPGAFNYCFGHGCKNAVATSLTAEEWWKIQGLFNPPASNAVEERKQVAVAVGRFERYVGAKLGTGEDRAGTFPGYGRNGQLDCVDEATNTTTFLRMLEHDGRFRWHSVRAPVSRMRGLAHSTATVVELEMGHRYAIDSWYFDNGMEASVVPLEAWVAGWAPE